MSEAIDTRPAPGALRRAVLLGLFAGTGVASGYLLSGLPNCELMSLIAALAGGVLGPAAGAASGALAATIFSLGNPLGPPVPLLLAAQALGLAGAGTAGGLVVLPLLRWRRQGRRWRAAGLGLLTGLAVTIAYDLLTNLAGMLAFQLKPAVALAGAVPFALVHLASNAPQFLILFPLLLDRFAGRARPPLRGGAAPSALAALGVLWVLGGAGRAVADAPAAPAGGSTRAAAADSAAAAADTLRAAAADTAAPPSFWRPFPAHLVERLTRDAPWVAWSDGGIGARLQLRHEAGTAPAPLVLRDGVPLGVGHRWADDPWSMAQTGLEVAAVGFGTDGWGGCDGVVDLAPADPDPTVSRVDTRFYKGTHGTYLRSVSARTQSAPWRARLDFEETLDQQGYGFAPAGDDRFLGVAKAGEARLRSRWVTLERQTAAGDRAALSFGSVRTVKSSLPAPDLAHEQIWADQAVLTWQGRRPAGALRAALFVAGADVEQEAREDWSPRKLEVAREGARLEVAGAAEPERRLAAAVTAWRLADDGVGTERWAAGWSGPARLAGTEAGLSAAAPLRSGPLRWRGEAAAWWAERGGWRPEAELACQPAGGEAWWRLALTIGGRAPRSDELATLDRAVLQLGEAARTAVFVPNPDLRGERLWRAALGLRRTLLGTALAFDGSARALRDGIGWEPLAGGVDVGRWGNTLALDAWCVTASAEREGRLLGHARARAAASWRGVDVRQGVPVGLPPRRSATLTVDWENHAFHEDGILEIGYQLEYRGPGDDPWLPAGWARLRPVTLHHLVLGFRLLGADLSLAVRNLADARARLSAGALGDGRELRWRLAWAFRR